MTIQLEIVSDIVCPWCWLGLRQAQAAIARFGDPDAVSLRFAPYQLDPDIPSGGADYATYMRSKMGDDGSRWAMMREALEAEGEAMGIPFRFEGITRRPNTQNAHRLVRWAQGQGLGEAAMERLFGAYFNEHLDIGDIGELVRLSESIGLMPDVVEMLLKSDEDRDAIWREELSYRRLGVSGVPTFIADGRFATQGAQGSEALLGLLERAQADGPGDR